jgi:hypothetical protein
MNFQGKHIVLLLNLGGMRIIPKSDIGGLPSTGGREGLFSSKKRDPED